MNLSPPQRGVLLGMALGLLVTLVCFAAVVVFEPLATQPATWLVRGRLFALCALLPAVALTVAIGRLAAQRFFTPQDLDGSALTRGTDRANLLQALLQNTLEQVVLALPVYAASLALAPERLLAVAPVAAALFLVGRLLFFRGYSRGAHARAFGFALTFYPSVLLLIGAAVLGIGMLAGR